MPAVPQEPFSDEADLDVTWGMISTATLSPSCHEQQANAVP